MINLIKCLISLYNLLNSNRILIIIYKLVSLVSTSVLKLYKIINNSNEYMMQMQKKRIEMNQFVT
jgi:hypothetical protein